MTEPAPTLGGIQLGEYRLVRSLRTKGGGVSEGDAPSQTYLAHDRALDRAVVLRFLPADPERRRRLLAVARGLAQVEHPSVSAVHGINVEGARPYIVLEYAEGVRLDAIGRQLKKDQLVAVGRALAGALAALHAAGVTHGAVRASHVVLSAEGETKLMGFGEARSEVDAEARTGDVRALASLLESLARPEEQASLAAMKQSTAEGLLAALAALDGRARSQADHEENPYRGLEYFEVEHADRFFGRQPPLARVLGWLRSNPWAVVAAPAGGGKSSFVRAGIGASVARGDLGGERPRWDVAVMTAGSRPLSALAQAIGPLLGRPDVASFASELRNDPAIAARLARKRRDAGLLLVVDPLDELFAAPDATEAAAFLEALEPFGTLAPGVRVVMTIQSSFLERLGDLAVVGQDLLAAVQVLPAMRETELREAIAGPARLRGYVFETPAMVDSLVREVGDAPDGLPLVEFALAELWKVRDVDQKSLPVAAFKRMGGIAQVLARHAEVVTASLDAEARREARRVLVQLARGPASREVLAPQSPEALEALVRGRLVVEGEAYKLVHPRLAEAWPRLRGWVAEASAERAQVARLTATAREWVRLGRGKEGLLGSKRLAEVSDVDLARADNDERDLVVTSRASLRRQRRRWFGAVAGLPLMVVAVAGAVFGTHLWHEKRATAAHVAARVSEAHAALAEARELDARTEEVRRDAFARYDADDWQGGEARWPQALELAARASDRYAAAAEAINAALAARPDDEAAVALAADIAYGWLLDAERDHAGPLVRELSRRLALVDRDGSRRARLSAPAHLRVTPSVRDSAVFLHRISVNERGLRVEGEGELLAGNERRALEAGSYLLSSRAEGRFPTRLPITLASGEDAQIDLALVPAKQVLPGYVYVPAGDFFFGSHDVESVRMAKGAQPEHRIHGDAFFIAVHETTYADYLDFLSTLPKSERAKRLPYMPHARLIFNAQGAPSLALEGARTVGRGELFCRPKRKERRCEDWLKMPVALDSKEAVTAYIQWLGKTRVRGARLCSEREWERTARGGDNRAYPWGDEVRPGDANFSETYEGDFEQLGVDPVGSFPLDRSPFDVDDLAGNVDEVVTRSVSPRNEPRRGGAWDITMVLASATDREDSARHLGVRVCATAP